MKTHLLLLSCLAVAPVAGLAQTKPTAVSIDPATKTLLDKATATYQAASGIRFSLSVNENSVERISRVSFQKPNLLRVETRSTPDGARPSLVVFKGTTRIAVTGKTIERQPVPASVPVSESLGATLNSGTGYLIVAMMEGRSPIAEIQSLVLKSPFPMRMAVTPAQPALIGGDVLRGVKIKLSPLAPTKGARTEGADIGLWFGADGLLRRVSTHDVRGAKPFATIEQISEQQLDPAFGPDTFVVNETGLKPVADKPASKAATKQQLASDENIYWDARLKAGTQPFAFSAKSLSGATISPAKYRGKVLLIDFWATWCGPCVAGLPELQSAYNKYHSQGLEVVGVSLDRQQSDLTTFIKARKMPWPQVFDPAQKTRIANLYGLRAIPFLLLIGRDGKIAAVNPRGNVESAVKKALAAK